MSEDKTPELDVSNRLQQAGYVRSWAPYWLAPGDRLVREEEALREVEAAERKSAA